jgi:hypothetical protein
MKKQELNNLLREYIKNDLSPTKEEQDLASSLYSAFKSVLGQNCFLTGSYARFTAIRPLHDLDIIFIAGKFDPNNLNPQAILSGLQKSIQSNFQNPTKYQIMISLQTHSISISFMESGSEKIAVDIVPALLSGEKNEFGDDIYFVPEILNLSRHNRKVLYASLTNAKKAETEWWIRSDPEGYIKATLDLNTQNSDFRKAAKFVKRWKHNCKEKNEDFGLKSFHVEQLIFRIFKQNPRLDITDAIFKFFCELPENIFQPQVKDRADPNRFIDSYISDLSLTQINLIKEARDAFLIKLEYLAEAPSISDLLNAAFHKRASNNKGCCTEQYLFDSNIPTFIEKDKVLRIYGTALPTSGGFRERILDAIGLIERERKIRFRITGDAPDVDLFKWKVKNDNRSIEPRGEITDHSTRNDPESTRYKGEHYVECYAIKDGVCIARARQGVKLEVDGYQ